MNCKEALIRLIEILEDALVYDDAESLKEALEELEELKEKIKDGDNN